MPRDLGIMGGEQKNPTLAPLRTGSRSNEETQAKEVEGELESGESGASSVAGSERAMQLEAELQEAVVSGEIEKVRTLLKANADVHETYENGLTVLHLAVLRGHEKIVPLLVHAGADPNAPTTDELRATPMQIAVHRQNAVLVQALSEGMPDTCHHRLVGPVALIAFVLLNCAVGSHLFHDARWDGWIEADGQIEQLKASDWRVVYMAIGTFLLCLVLTNQLDPGTVKRREVQHIREFKHLPEDQVINLAEDRFAVIKDTDPNNVSLDNFDYFRWCRSCEMWKPRNVSHCSRCRRCFWRFDHHCWLVGNCVAARNHRFFAGMLVSGAIAWVICIQCVFSSLASHGAFSSADLWWPPRAEQGDLYIGLLFFIVGCGSGLVSIWAAVHAGALFCNYNTRMCLKPAPDKGLRYFNSRLELQQLFCMPLRFRKCGASTPDDADEFEEGDSFQPLRMTDVLEEGNRSPRADTDGITS